MSCTSTSTTNPGTVCSPCGFAGVPDPENEPLASAVQNLTDAMFGSVTKTLVNGAISWTLPCDLNGTGLETNPRAEGEGIACYLLRLITEGAVSASDGIWYLPDVNDLGSLGQVYVKNGALFYKSPALTVTQIAPN